MRKTFKRLFGGGDEKQPSSSTLPVIQPEDVATVGEYRRILEEMAIILHRNGYPTEEAMVRDALDALQSDTRIFVELVTGGSIWGGSGSLSDCNFRGLSAASPVQAQVDQKRKYELLSSLASRLVHDGMRNPRIESLGQAYTTWAKRRGLKLWKRHLIHPPGAYVSGRKDELYTPTIARAMPKEMTGHFDG